MTTPITRPTLDDITAASLAVRDAEGRLRSLAVAAVESGESVSAVAQAADVHRQTVYRWCDQPAKVVVGEALDDVLGLVIERGWGDTPQMVAGLRSGDVLVKARRVHLATKNLSPVETESLTEQELDIIRSGAHAAAMALSDNTVTLRSRV